MNDNSDRFDPETALIAGVVRTVDGSQTHFSLLPTTFASRFVLLGMPMPTGVMTPALLR
jgi:hypothetical protein